MPSSPGSPARTAPISRSSCSRRDTRSTEPFANRQSRAAGESRICARITLHEADLLDPESAALAGELGEAEELRLVSSWLLHTEMHCAAGRHPEVVDLTLVRAVLEAMDLIDLTRGDLLAAGALAPLRSNDAIHLAVALRVAVEEIVTYDTEQSERARSAGLSVLAPGIHDA